MYILTVFLLYFLETRCGFLRLNEPLKTHELFQTLTLAETPTLGSGYR